MVAKERHPSGMSQIDQIKLQVTCAILGHEWATTPDKIIAFLKLHRVPNYDLPLHCLRCYRARMHFGPDIAHPGEWLSFIEEPK